MDLVEDPGIEAQQPLPLRHVLHDDEGDDLYFTVQRLQKITKQVFVCTVILSLPFLVCLSLSRSSYKRFFRTDPQVLTGLSDIHRLNLVHCDLMPESVV